MENEPLQDMDQSLPVDRPAWLLDTDRTVIAATPLFFWLHGLLRLGEAIDTTRLLELHSYEVWARAIEAGVFSPQAKSNEPFVAARLDAVLGKNDEQDPAVQHFLRLVFATPEGRQYWLDLLARFRHEWDVHDSQVFAYPIYLTPPDAAGGLHFIAHGQRPGGRRRIIYTPQDEPTATTVAAAAARIRQHYPELPAVLGVSQFTATASASGQTVGDPALTMSTEQPNPPPDDTRAVSSKTPEAGQSAHGEERSLHLEDRYTGTDPGKIEETARRLEQRGVIFQRAPANVYPQMPYATADDLMEQAISSYSRPYISRLAQKGDIDAVLVGSATLITPCGVEQLLQREQKSRAGELHPGQQPGPRGERKPQRNKPRRKQRPPVPTA